MASAVVGFSDLPTEALDEIARRVGPLDNFHCSAVVRPWRRALRATRLGQLDEPHRPHIIFLHNDYYHGPAVVEVTPIHGREGTRTMKTVVDGGKLRDYTRTTIIGCSYGWIVAVYRHDDTRAICLIDPFTGRRFTLPQFTDSSRSTYKQQEELKTELRSKRKAMFTKAALAPGRRLGTYAVMLIHSGGQGLSFLKQTWLCSSRASCARATPATHERRGNEAATSVCFSEAPVTSPDLPPEPDHTMARRIEGMDCPDPDGQRRRFSLLHDATEHDTILH